MTTLTIPRQRDPMARLTLLALTGLVAWLGVTHPGMPASAQVERPTAILIATPTLPTAAFAPQLEQPTAIPEPTAAPIVELAAPTLPPEQLPLPEPPAEQAAPIIQQVIVQAPPEVVYVEVTPDMSAVIAAEEAAAAQQATAAAEQQRVLERAVQPTLGPGEPGFADSFVAPDPNAKCAFVGCLP